MKNDKSIRDAVHQEIATGMRLSDAVFLRVREPVAAYVATSGGMSADAVPEEWREDFVSDSARVELVLGLLDEWEKGSGGDQAIIDLLAFAWYGLSLAKLRVLREALDMDEP